MSRRNRHENPITLFAFQDIITSVTGILILITLLLALALVDRPVPESRESRESIEDLRSQLTVLEQDIKSLRQQSRADSTIVQLMTQYGTNSIEELITHLETSLQNASRLIQSGREELAAGEEFKTKNQKRLDDQASSMQELLARLKEQQELLDRMKAGNRVIYEVSGSASDQPWLLELGGTQWQLAKVNKREKPVLFDQSKPGDRLKALIQWAKSHPGRKYLVLLIRPGGVESYDLVRRSTSLTGVEFGVDLIPSDVTVIDPDTGAVAR